MIYYYDGLTKIQAKCDTCGVETACGVVTSDDPNFLRHFCSDACYDIWKENPKE